MRSIPLRLALACLTLCCLGSAAAADGVDDYVTAQMQKRHIPGLSLAVVRGGRVLKMRGYGLASVEFGVPADENTVYQIASVTKSFTATAVMMLVEEGKVGLDDKLSRYLTGLPPAWDGVTIRHLLTHTSGVVGEPIPWSLDTVAKYYPREEYLKIILGAPLQFAPGTRYSYANPDYYLLAVVIEKASGRPYAEFLSERIFRPLGMSSTRVNDPWAVVKNRAGAYGWDDGRLVVPLLFHPSQTMGSGDLLSTVSDLVKFEEAVASGRLLKKSSVEQMWTPARLADGGEVGYGFGWTIFNSRGHRVVGHGGNTIGFASQVSRYTQDDTAIILLCNIFRGDDAPFKLSSRLAGFFIPDLAVPAAPAHDPDPQFTAKFRALLEGVAEARADASLFTPRMRGYLTEDALKAMQRQYAQEYGPLKSVSLLERRADGGYLLYMYRAVFEKKTLFYYLKVTKGEIDDFGQEPEDG